MTRAMSAQRNSPEPWPMKWIILSIVLCLGTYTFLTLHFRKQNPTYQPYADMKNRANTLRLLSAGYQRVTIAVQRPADPIVVRGGAAITQLPGGLPSELRTTLVEQPVLPGNYARVAAAGSTSALLPYPVEFNCSIGDNHHQLLGAQLYLKEHSLVIVPEFETLDGQLLARSRDTLLLLTLPGGTLKPGRYQVALSGSSSSPTWTLQVN